MDEKILNRKTKDELINLAREGKIKITAKMTKPELISEFLKKSVQQLRKMSKAKAQKPVAKEKVLPKKKQRKEKEVSISKKERLTPKPFFIPDKEVVEVTKFEAGRETQSKGGFSPQAQAKTALDIVEKIELEHHYGEDSLVLMVRDPWWLYAYWEATLATWDRVRAQVPKKSAAKEVLRVYDVTDVVDFNGKNFKNFFDIELTSFNENWYINVGKPNRSFCVELGLRISDGKFYMLLRSNVVKTPRYGASDVTDEEWMVSDEDYWKMFGLAGGYGIGKGSQEIQEMFKKRFDEIVSSGFPGSVFSWMQKEDISRDFWLVADAELIIYGATKPDAELTVQGKKVKLNPDGSFSLRYAFPDGKQEIPIQAVSSDGVDKRSIKITVNRNTVKGT